MRFLIEEERRPSTSFTDEGQRLESLILSEVEGWAA